MPLLTKPMLPDPIPAVPTPVPQRTDRANFAERGDRMMAWLPPGMSAVQQHTGYVEAAAAYVEQESDRAQLALSECQAQVALAEQWAGNAMSIGHYKGPWNSLAGDLARPATVTHGGLFYALNYNLANVAAAEPGGHDAWTVLPGLTEIGTPINLAPTGDAVVGSGAAIVLQTSAFATVYTSDTLANSQWQIHTYDSFSVPVYDSGAVAGAAVFTVPSAVVQTFASSTRYYWRCRHRSSRGKWSAWSRASSFVTASALGQYIPTPEAVPASYGAPHQGGYYAGMIWQEIARCSETKIVATGAAVKFILDAAYDMYTKPLVYVGQMLHIRSRATPNILFGGYVVSANGRELTVNVTGVGGGGSANDWSVMARYRCIVAPKSSGETSGKPIKSTATALPAAAATLTDGLASTLAMFAAGDASTWPAAHWVRSLSIGGYTDWYIPARDELELMGRNLSASQWYPRAYRVSSPIHNYANRGALADAVAQQGANRNSAPEGAPYVNTPFVACPNPAFGNPGTEGMATGVYAEPYFSSTEYDVGNVWCMYRGPASQDLNYQNPNAVTSVRILTRAMRRSVV